MPRSVLTDRGKGFIAEANLWLYKKLGIKKLFTSAYHPQTNAKAERVVQEVKKALRMVNISLDDEFTKAVDLKNHPVDVATVIKKTTLLLPTVQFDINQKVSNMSLISPHMMIHGKNLNDIVDLKLARELYTDLPSNYGKQSYFEIVNQLRVAIETTQQRYDDKWDKYIIILKDNFDIDKYHDNYSIGDLVAYFTGDRASTNKKLRRRFTGPWKIVDRLRDNVLVIENKTDGERIATHATMLKPYYADHFVPYSELLKSQRSKLLDEIRNPNSKSSLKKSKSVNSKSTNSN